MILRSSFRLHCLLTIAAALILGLSVTPALAQFETRATAIMPQQGAFSIAGGDFNHDGYFDVVIIDDNGFTVSLGKGDGTFQKAVYYPTSQLTYSVAVGDFNNDGNLDIVFANLGPSTVTVYLGNGDGTFQSPISSNTTDGSYFVTVGDFNNDKKQDIAIIDPPYISVLLGNGDGTFQAPSDNSSFFGGKWLAVGDFNNDHKLDVLVTGYFGSSYNVGVLFGNGNGTLQDSITTPIDYVPATIAAGDLNKDGKTDAVLSYDLGGIAVLLGNGDGTFASPVNYNTTGISAIEAIVADLKLDGRLDVLIPTSLVGGKVEGIDVFWGNGDGTLRPAQFLQTGVQTGLAAVGDLNGDGLPDVVLADGVEGTITMLNTGAVSFSPSTAPLTFLQPGQQIVKLTNTGKKALSITSVKESGTVFQVRQNCGSSLPSGASCNISVLFKPTHAGTYNGVVTINDNASSKPQFVELLGFSN
jgi:FG-GAP-like repeat/Abnormal spindle-like microcephaly-assoc'd, ASPM-SPD-2-Hydin